MEQPTVSIILPTKNSEQFIGDCLQSIKEQTYNEIEVIVVDNNSTDKTKEIALGYTDKVFNRGPERSAQRNYGVSKSKGEYVLIPDSDMVFTKDVVKECIEVVIKDKNVKAIIIPEQSFGTGFWAKCKALERSCYIGDASMEASRFFEKKVFNEFGGYDEENTGTEDYDLPFRIKNKYLVQGRVNALILHNEGNFKLTKSMRKKYYYAQDLKKYIAKHPQVFKNQAKLIRPAFLKNWRKIFRNPILGVGMIIMKCCEMGAGGIGFVKGSIRK